MNDSDEKEINEVIKGYGLKLNLISKLQEKIDLNASGFELALFTNKISEKMVEVRNGLTENKYFKDIKIGKAPSMGALLTIIQYSKIIGTSIILHDKDKREYKQILDIIRRIKEETKSEIGYYEFLKISPKPKEFDEEILHAHDLEDFIKFLDKQYQIWEKSKPDKR